MLPLSSHYWESSRCWTGKCSVLNAKPVDGYPFTHWADIYLHSIYIWLSWESFKYPEPEVSSQSVGSPGCWKLQIYLYHFAKKGALCSTFKAKKGGQCSTFPAPKSQYFGRNLFQWTNFDKNFGEMVTLWVGPLLPDSVQQESWRDLHLTSRKQWQETMSIAHWPRPRVPGYNPVLSCIEWQ